MYIFCEGRECTANVQLMIAGDRIAGHNGCRLQVIGVLKSIDRSLYLTKKNSLIMFHHREIIYEKIDMVLQMT